MDFNLFYIDKSYNRLINYYMTVDINFANRKGGKAQYFYFGEKPSAKPISNLGFYFRARARLSGTLTYSTLIMMNRHFGFTMCYIISTGEKKIQCYLTLSIILLVKWSQG